MSGRPRSRRTLPALAVAALLVVALVAPLSTTQPARADDAAVVADASLATDPPTFERETVVEHAGDVVAVGLGLANGSTATVRIAPDDGAGDGYAATVVVRDADGDGRVRLRVNTYLAGREDGTFEAAGADRVVRADESSGPMTAGTYVLVASPGGADGTTPSATPTDAADEATLVLRERTTRALTVWQATRFPSDLQENLTSVAAIRSATRADRLRTTDWLRQREFVLRLEATGLSGALAAEEGANATARFFALLARPGVALRATENRSTVDAGVEPARFDLAHHDATTVVPDPGNDTYYLVVDIDEASVDGGGPEPAFRPDDVLEFAFVVDEPSPLAAGEREAATASVEMGSWRAEVHPDVPLVVDDPRDAVVAGVTNVPPGEAVTVVVRADTPANVTRRTNATVGPDDRFAAGFDLSGLPSGATFEVAVRYSGRDRLSRTVEGVVGGSPASVTFEDQLARESGTRVTVESARLPVGGFVALHLGKLTGPIVGVSEYLEPGTHENVTVELHDVPENATTLVAMPHVDSDDDRTFDFLICCNDDGPYFVNETVLTDAATVGFPTPTPSPIPSPTPTPTATPTAAPTSSDTPTSTDEATPTPTGTTAPGFALAGALAGLVGAVLLAARRAP